MFPRRGRVDGAAGRQALVALCLVAAAAGCTGDDAPAIETARVTSGEVVQTVAAAAELEPAGRVTVTAPVGGEVANLLVGDGDVVASGDPVARLASDSIDLQVAQAQAAVDAADALAAASAGAGMDFSPVIGAFGSQLDAVFPPLLAAMRGQLDALERAATDVADAAGDLIEFEGDPAAAAAEARARLDEAEQGYLDARASLAAAQADTRQQAANASAGQRAAANAQREQAELALEAARARIDELTLVAPAGGVVELARGSDGGAAAVPDLDDLAAGGMPDVEALLEGDGTGSRGSGPIAEGVTVGPGQPLLTIFDLSAFTARVSVDEIDVVEVEVGHAVVVLVDAYPGTEIAGRVAHVALEPERLPAGGAIFPVTVELRRVPEEVRLRIGLTASAEIEVRRIEADTVVPTSSLLRRGGDEVVHVVRDGIAREVPVEVVAMGDDTAAIDGEVAPGERVVTTGVELIEDGQDVGGAGS